jgi:hypothetical protein
VSGLTAIPLVMTATLLIHEDASLIMERAMKKDEFIAYDAYMKLAKKYAEIIDIKPHNAEYERPGLLRIMPYVQGRKVLDAGCGSGSLARALSSASNIHSQSSLTAPQTTTMMSSPSHTIGQVSPKNP